MVLADFVGCYILVMIIYGHVDSIEEVWFEIVLWFITIPPLVLAIYQYCMTWYLLHPMSGDNNYNAWQSIFKPIYVWIPKVAHIWTDLIFNPTVSPFFLIYWLKLTHYIGFFFLDLTIKFNTIENLCSWIHIQEISKLFSINLL